MNGRNWSEIVNKHFPNRTSLSAKNRYSILQRRRETAAEPVTSSISETASPGPRLVPLLMVEQPEESQASSSATAAAIATETGLAGFSRLTEGNMNEFLQQSIGLSDGWYTDSTLSEVSTPRLPSDLDWTAAWSPNPSSLDASGCYRGLMNDYNTDICYPVSSSTDVFPMENYNMGDFYLPNDHSSESTVPATYPNGFLFPDYGQRNW